MNREPGMQHAKLEILLEKRIRKAESPEEAGKLDGHLSECQRCRQELERVRKEEEMLRQETADFVEGFDWNAAEQAIRQALALAPDNADFCTTLGEILQGQEADMTGAATPVALAAA